MRKKKSAFNPVEVSRRPKTVLKPQVKEIEFKTDRQQEFYDAIFDHQITFGVGSPGTGKSLVGIYYACEALVEDEVEKIYLTKPAVEVGGSLGFLPGKMDEKFGPYARSGLEHFYDLVGQTTTATWLQQKKIEVLPLEYMRGLNFDNCIVIAEECQNAQYVQMKTLMTRLGENSKLILNGDFGQCDLRGRSPLRDIVNIVKPIEEVGIVEFTHDDIVRSGIVKKLMIEFDKYEASNDIDKR